VVPPGLAEIALFDRCRSKDTHHLVNRQHRCLPNDTGVQRRMREGAKRLTRPSDCNGGLGSAREYDCISSQGSVENCGATEASAR
jgi:hypothetical protein